MAVFKEADPTNTTMLWIWYDLMSDTMHPVPHYALIAGGIIGLGVLNVYWGFLMTRGVFQVAYSVLRGEDLSQAAAKANPSQVFETETPAKGKGKKRD